MEYAVGSSRKDPGQGHINLLPSDVVITEAPMKQFEPCHCCKTYDRPCLRNSFSKKKSDHSEVSKGYANPRPEINGKKEKAPTGPSGVQCNTRFIKEHKPSNHIRARIKSHVYTTE